MAGLIDYTSFHSMLVLGFDSVCMHISCVAESSLEVGLLRHLMNGLGTRLRYIWLNGGTIMSKWIGSYH